MTSLGTYVEKRVGFYDVAAGERRVGIVPATQLPPKQSTSTPRGSISRTAAGEHPLPSCGTSKVPKYSQNGIEW